MNPEHLLNELLKINDLSSLIIPKFKEDRFSEKIRLFNVLQQIVKSKGGKMGSNDSLNYDTSHGKLPIICPNNHYFELCLNNAKKGRWCPDCHIYMGELIAKCALIHLLEKPFNKVRPPWLRTPTDSYLELDAYNEEYNLGMEYHGVQHYEFIEHFHRTQEMFERRLQYDQLKIELCAKHNTKLIIIPYTVTHDMICIYIHTELTKLGYAIPNERIASFDMTNFKDLLSKTLQIKNLIEQKGGTLMGGTVVDDKSPLIVMCEEGHEWMTKYAYIKKGSWCNICGLSVDDDTKQKISTSMKKYNETPEGKVLKKQSLQKRSDTMQKEKDELRASITHKICGNDECANKDIMQPTSAFNKKTDAKDGYQTNCKICVNIIKQQWRLDKKQ